jgi:hypothetical protein
VKALFGPCINWNGYRYTYTNNEQLIAQVEKLWMTSHQKAQMPTTRMINKAETMGIICQKKGHDFKGVFLQSGL